MSQRGRDDIRRENTGREGAVPEEKSTMEPAHADVPRYEHHGAGEHSHRHIHGEHGHHLHRHQHAGGEQEHTHAEDDSLHVLHPDHSEEHHGYPDGWPGNAPDKPLTEPGQDIG